MIVGVLYGDCISDYYELSRNSPIELIQPLLLYCSDPDKPSKLEDRVRAGNLVVSFRPVMYRHLYNPATQVPGYYAACIEMTNINSGKVSLGSELDFTPYALIALDGMRSSACRSFLRSFSNALTQRILDFKLFVADRHNPDHKFVFDQYNPEAQIEFQSAGSLGDNFT